MTLLGTVATILYITSTATATGPAPSNVRIKGVSVLGSGCPAGTADVQVDATFSTYECIGAEIASFTLNMEFDQGYQYVLVPLWSPSLSRAEQSRAGDVS
ncbi:hypothetical protein CRV24_008387 [Beauveria bassiana]|nr:hypothetical protein CRV24_008387 [Beauveria bassiana]KAH8716465.1 hypothetical protein HC256_005234 [Beauveria bassiana]